ncbi:ABC transporter ATP-binding protein [Planctellipticum variicoloris]|uniref:ABC transporter ATP-binding protein n=1 Tax=Planctellipticum variicoloris TaxID=3064265 RepID=UPI0030132B00|nr:ATP-binding cassette domain-containing protein [Planctomycetaceae bacterium SH412]
MSAPPPALELRHATRRFGTRTVLHDISFGVHVGEVLVIIGESGCGKSVTTKLLAGLLEPSEGEVLWAGRPIADRTRDELRRDRLRLGYLFQGAALFDSLSVFENVAFGLRENGRRSNAEIQQIVAERLREVGLSPDVGKSRPADLSGGMRKRVGLARALAVSPEIIFYDEPTTGLDPVMSDVINELILQTQARHNVTSVVVTHDMNTVRRVADRVVMLEPFARLSQGDSQVIFEGTPEEVFASTDPCVGCFVRGEAGERLRDLFAA